MLKQKKIRWYWGIYISPENEAQSLQLFFDNEKFQTIFEKYSINLNDDCGKKLQNDFNKYWLVLDKACIEKILKNCGTAPAR